MRRLLALLSLLGLSVLALGQSTDPQPDFVTAVQSAKPATWLRFNGSSATNFTDATGGPSFGTSLLAGILPTPTADAGTGAVYLSSAPLRPGLVTSVSLQFYTVPTAGTWTLVVYSMTGTNGTLAHSFTVNVAATTAVQTFHAPTDFTAFAVGPPDLGGWWTPSSAANAPGQGSTGSDVTIWADFASGGTPPSSADFFNAGAGTAPDIQFTVTSAAVTPQQPGFDLTQPTNYTVSIPYDGWIAAPDTTTADLEWSDPWSITMVVDSIDFDKLTNTPLILASKGDLTDTSGAYWALEIGDDLVDTVDVFPLTTQACWVLQAPTPGLGEAVVLMKLCSAKNLDLINKKAGPYVFTLTNDGDGWTDGFHFYINGIEGGGQSLPLYFAQDAYGFDPATLSLSGGTGYPDSCPFTSTGGGANCVVTGNMLSSGGTPSTVQISRSSGCPSTPTIVIPACGSGTGATVTATPHTSSLRNSYPLMIGSLQGMSTNSNQSAVTVDELAIFNTALSGPQILDQSNGVPWYQTILGAPPAVPRKLLFSDDGGDADNNFALNEAIKLHKLHYLQILGVDHEETQGVCQALFRQYLDQAGLSDIPVSTAYTFDASGSGCYPTNIAAYNGNTPLSSASYESTVTLFRTALAANPSTPVDIFIGGPHTGLAAFMQSGADSISPLTGAQLLAQDATNGGRIFDQGNPLNNVTCTPSALPDPYPCSGSTSITLPGWDWTSTQYVYAHNGSMPIYVMTETPQFTGPGAFDSRTAKDPFYLFLNTLGTDTRQGWDPMVLANIIVPQFRGGLSLAFSGGTGCPTYAPLVSSGGGGEIDGWLLSSGGVPGGVLFPGGGNAYEQWEGIGDSYTSLPTITATGCSGVTITPYLTTGCVTYTVSGISGDTATVSVDSATCSSQYQTPFSWKPAGIGDIREPTFLGWFVNSLTNAAAIGRPRP